MDQKHGLGASGNRSNVHVRSQSTAPHTFNKLRVDFDLWGKPEENPRVRLMINLCVHGDAVMTSWCCNNFYFVYCCRSEIFGWGAASLFCWGKSLKLHMETLSIGKRNTWWSFLCFFFSGSPFSCQRPYPAGRGGGSLSANIGHSSKTFSK